MTYDCNSLVTTEVQSFVINLVKTRVLGKSYIYNAGARAVPFNNALHALTPRSPVLWHRLHDFKDNHCAKTLSHNDRMTVQSENAARFFAPFFRQWSFSWQIRADVTCLLVVPMPGSGPVIDSRHRRGFQRKKGERWINNGLAGRGKNCNGFWCLCGINVGLSCYYLVRAITRGC